MELDNGSIRGGSDVLPSQTQSTLTLAASECKTDGDYNPFEHRRVTHPTSTSGSFFHLLKSSLGSGLLAMPAAFKHSGLVPGCIGTVVVAVVATHCVHILYPTLFVMGMVGYYKLEVTTSRDICRKCHVASLSYTETCEKVFRQGPKRLRRFTTFVRHFVDSAMAGVCLGGTSVYVIFIASTLKDLCDHLAPGSKLAVEVYCAILTIPLILITQVRYLKFLVPCSLVANLCLLATFGITCYYTFIDIPDVRQAKLVGNITQWPLFLSTAIFAMEGINVVMPVENEMANPEHFLGCPGVLNVTMAVVAALYGVVGVFGYLKYGDAVLGSVTLNLPQDEIPALTAKILVATAVFFTYCLQMYAPMDIIWTRLRGRVRGKIHNIAQILLRSVSVILTVALAAAVPDLELLIGLVGAIFFSTLGLLIPVVVETVHRWDQLKQFHPVFWKNGVLLLFYFVVLVSGCYSAIREIVVRFS